MASRPVKEHLIPVLQPHLHWIGDALLSVGGEAPLPVSPQEAQVARLIDGRSTIATLRERAPGLDEPLESLVRHALVVLVDPTPLPAGRRRVCALSPHADDVALSIGGLLHALRSSWDTTLATVTSRSVYSRWGSLQGDELRVSALRGREDALYAIVLGSRRITSPLPDAGARAGHESVFHSPSEADLALFAGTVAAMIVDCDTVLAPLAIGNHVDHCAITSVLLTHLSRLPPERRPQLLLYEDLPYATAMPGAVEARVQELAEHGTELHPLSFDIDLTAKLRGIAIYQSQYDPDHVAAMIAGYGERVWEAKRIGAAPLFSGPACVPNW